MKTTEEDFPPEKHLVFDGYLADAYTRLRARAVEMERALAEIATQQLAQEMDDFATDHADWEGGYEALVEIARKALPPTPDHHQPKP
jgi:hypothetical protein